MTSKHVCTNCGFAYGDGPQTNKKKMQRGFCADCWRWLLAYQAYHWQEIRLSERRDANEFGAEETR